MTFLEVMEVYFRGEKLEAFFFILPAGLVLLGLAAAALKAESGGFAWGVAVPCALFGLVLVGTGLGVGLRTDNQVAELRRAYEEAPAAMAAEELPRMEKVNANFRSTFIAFGVLAVLGVVLILGVRSDWAVGLGSVLVLASGIGFLVDGFASRRAVPYTAELIAISGQSGGGQVDASTGEARAK